jgi:hypothetical protein
MALDHGSGVPPMLTVPLPLLRWNGLRAYLYCLGRFSSHVEHTELALRGGRWKRHMAVPPLSSHCGLQGKASLGLEQPTEPHRLLEDFVWFRALETSVGVRTTSL